MLYNRKEHTMSEKTVVGVRIAPEMHEELVAIAKREEMPVSFLIRRAIRMLLRNDKVHPEETVDLRPPKDQPHDTPK